MKRRYDLTKDQKIKKISPSAKEWDQNAPFFLFCLLADHNIERYIEWVYVKKWL